MPGLRIATPADAAGIAEICLDARAAVLPDVHWAHPPDDVRHWIATVLLKRGGVWAVERDGALLGFVALHADWVEQLYVAPAHWRQGVGDLLLRHAKAMHPSGLRLWCFQANAPARAFYEAHGFVALSYSDGADNEEREPDILYAWPAAAWQAKAAGPGSAAPGAA